MMQGGSHIPRYIENGVDVQHYTVPREQSTCLFKNIDRLAADHDVTVSSTMIKVTYNKNTKDHTLTTVSGSEYHNKRHTIAFKPSLCDNFNNKLSAAIKNHRKSFNAIVLNPMNMDMANNGDSMNRSIQKMGVDDCTTLLTQVHCNASTKKVLHRNVDVKNKEFSNTLEELDEHHKKELRVFLTRINIDRSEEQGRESVEYKNHIKKDVANCEDHVNGEVDTKNFVKSDNLKFLSKSKSSSSIDDSVSEKMKKYKVKKVVHVNLKKERLNSVKGKKDDFKGKKRVSTSNEDFTVRKKLKTSSSDASQRETTDKATAPKVKDNVKRIKLDVKGKKSTSKAASNQERPKGYSRKRELLQDDPNLPPGWKRIIKHKNSGSELKPIVCIVSPEGRKFYFKAGLRDYLARTNSPLAIENFHFGLYKKVNKAKGPREPKRRVNEGKSGARGKDAGEKAKKCKLYEAVSEGKMKEMRCVPSSGSQPESGNFPTDTEKRFKVEVLDSNCKKNFLLVDPDLPAGWTRKIRIKMDGENCNRFQVCLVSPEGRRFKGKNLLQKYLNKIRSTLNINQFYFGMYPKNDSEASVSVADRSGDRGGKPDDRGHGVNDGGESTNRDGEMERTANQEVDCHKLSGKQMPFSWTKVDDDGCIAYDKPMLEDVTLPPGWRRYIRVLSTGEGAGRMEVIILSPDGKRHKSRGGLEHYFKQKGLDLKVEDFDFSIFGRNAKRIGSDPPSTPQPNIRKRNSLFLPSETSFPNLNFSHPALEGNKTREALMINYVSGLMLNCGLRELRTERRLRIPREEHEKNVKKYFDSKEGEGFTSENGASSHWVRKLITCRSDFASVDGDAISTIASLTEEFLRGLTRRALAVSETQSSLGYGDVASVVDQTQCLSPLKTLIPKKITFREFIRLNRPKKFTSFT